MSRDVPFARARMLRRPFFLPFTLSPSHPLTLSPSHPLTLTSALEPKDNEWLLSSSEDSSSRLWNLAARTSVCAYRASAESRHPIWDVACNPLGYYFASASHDGTATLWSLEYASPLRRFVGHLSDVDTVRFHPNGLMVATGSLDRSVRLWDVRSGSCVRVLGRAHQHSSRGSASGGSGGHLGGVDGAGVLAQRAVSCVGWSGHAAVCVGLACRENAYERSVGR